MEKCKDPKSVTIFVRGSTSQVVGEVERSLTDVIGALSSAVEKGKYVIGGGSIEIDVANALREYSSDVGGREQLAIQAFAESVEIIPRTLAESAGMDPIDTLVQLRNKHKGKEGRSFGVDVYKNSIGNMVNLGVIEPLRVKQQAYTSATEASEIILRIDDMISSKGRGPAGGMPPGGMPGAEE